MQSYHYQNQIKKYDLKFRKYEQKTESLIRVAEMIIDDYESGRNKQKIFWYFKQ